MAGLCKPDVIGLRKEAKYNIVDLNCYTSRVNFNGQGLTTKNNCGLFDGIRGSSWSSINNMYWEKTSDYLEIEILSDEVNIWRSGHSTHSNYYCLFQIYRWNGSEYINITTDVVQVATKITETQWEKTISNLKRGRYKFVLLDDKERRIDSEWYIEDLNSNKYLIKQLDKYYSIELENYDTYTKKFMPLELEDTIITEDKIKTFAFDNIGILSEKMTAEEDTFRPIDVLEDKFEIKYYKEN